MDSKIDSENGMHPELNSLNQELKLIDLAVSNHARPYGYITAGEALNKVQEQQLFKHLYNSFDEFCFNRYKFQAEQGFKLIRASNLARLLKGKGFSILPEFESHARYLTKFLTYNQHDIITTIWLELISSGKKITVRKIKNLIDRYNEFSNSPSSGSKAPRPAFMPPQLHNNLSTLNSIDLQRELEENKNPPRPSKAPRLHNSTPILHDSTPQLLDFEENYLVEELTDRLKEEGRKNRQMFNINLKLANDFSIVVSHITKIIEVIETSITAKDFKLQELTNQIESLQQILAEKDDALNQYRNYAYTIEEQRKLDLTNWNNALSHSASRCNDLERQLNNQRTEKNINTIDINYKNI